MLEFEGGPFLIGFVRNLWVAFWLTGNEREIWRPIPISKGTLIGTPNNRYP